MTLEPLWFMVFSNLEAFALCGLCMAIFRFKVSEFVWQILIVVTLMNLQSFILRNELSLSFVVPLTNIAFIAFLFATIVRVSFLGSLTISVVGMACFALTQSLLAILLFGSVAAIDNSEVNGYILQAVTALIIIPCSHLLYKFGYGFSYDFEKIRLKNERKIVIGSMITFIAIMTVVLYLNEVASVILLLVASLIFFLRYAIKKERDI